MTKQHCCKISVMFRNTYSYTCTRNTNTLDPIPPAFRERLTGGHPTWPWGKGWGGGGVEMSFPEGLINSLHNLWKPSTSLHHDFCTLVQRTIIIVRLACSVLSPPQSLHSNLFLQVNLNRLSPLMYLHYSWGAVVEINTSILAHEAPGTPFGASPETTLSPAATHCSGPGDTSLQSAFHMLLHRLNCPSLADFFLLVKLSGFKHTRLYGHPA